MNWHNFLQRKQSENNRQEFWLLSHVEERTVIVEGASEGVLADPRENAHRNQASPKACWRHQVFFTHPLRARWDQACGVSHQRGESPSHFVEIGASLQEFHKTVLFFYFLTLHLPFSLVETPCYFPTNPPALLALPWFPPSSHGLNSVSIGKCWNARRRSPELLGVLSRCFLSNLLACIL